MTANINIQAENSNNQSNIVFNLNGVDVCIPCGTNIPSYVGYAIDGVDCDISYITKLMSSTPVRLVAIRHSNNFEDVTEYGQMKNSIITHRSIFFDFVSR